MLLPPSLRVLDRSAVTFGTDALRGNVALGKPALGWSAAETAVGCRIRDYGSGVPHWSPLYQGSGWRQKEDREGVLTFKDFKTGTVAKIPFKGTL